MTVVIGCGSVGLLGIMAATDGWRVAPSWLSTPCRSDGRVPQALGAVVVEPGPEVARAVAALGGRRGADSVMEFVGLPAAQRLAWEILRPGGVMAVIGCHSAPSFAFSPAEAYDKNLTYRTGRCPARHYMERLTDRVARELPHIAQVVTHRFAPSDCVRAYDVFAHQRDGCVKAVFEFGHRSASMTVDGSSSVPGALESRARPIPTPDCPDSRQYFMYTVLSVV